MLPGGRGGELVVIALVALIVIGPKDLPKMLRTLGRFVGKMRSMADEFRASFEDMARQSELDDLRKEVEALRSGQTPSILGDIHNEIENVHMEMHKPLLDAPIIEAKSLSDVAPTPIEPLATNSEPVPVIAEPIVKPKRVRAKKAETMVTDIVAEPIVAEKPKRVRAKKTSPTLDQGGES